MSRKLQYPEEIQERIVDDLSCSSIGEGWFDIVRELDRQIAVLAPDYKLNQIKEKFGGLCYYIKNVPDDHHVAVNSLIMLAERQALSTCDVCGEKGSLRIIKGWYSTRCEQHSGDDTND